MLPEARQFVMIHSMQRVNAILNRFNMYILMRVYLGTLILIAAGLSFLDYLPYDSVDILLTSIYLIVACIAFNWVFAWWHKAATSLDSPIITAMILTLIVSPLSLTTIWWLPGVLAFVAMAVKYNLSFYPSHIFNPAALAVVISAVVLSQPASWWVGTQLLTPFIILGGLVIIQKIQRWELIGTFLGAYLFLTVAISMVQGTLSSLPTTLETLLLYSPLLFFTFVMLVEPATSPTKLRNQITYGATTAVAVVLLQHVDIAALLGNPGITLPSGFELGLLLGNVFAAVSEPSRRHKLKLTATTEEAADTASFHFKKPFKLTYAPGQFMVWTLPHRHADARGNRRWFTISSSPTEDELMITMRFSESSSSFKRAIRQLEPGDHITAHGPGGEFTLPKDADQPLIWIAGGIGITPFRSMAKYLYDTGETRDITLFYGNPTTEAIAFKDTFDDIAGSIGLKPVYAITDETPPEGTQFEYGFINADMIERHAPGYAEAVFYLSGPQPMVESFEAMLRDMGIKRDRIKTDYFPGYEDT